MLEVEIKADLGELKKEEIQGSAAEMGFVPADSLQEIDIYFNGNDRNFIKTDEALRLRSCRNLTTGSSETFITYKGPKLDQKSSTRQEYETAVGNLAVMRNLLTALGYKEVFTVDKMRREWKMPSADGKAAVTLCLDSVAGLGDYLELETLTKAEGERDAAVEQLLQLLDKLGISRDHLTRKSYLELLMQR